MYPSIVAYERKMMIRAAPDQNSRIHSSPSFPYARRRTRENTHLTNDARVVVVIEDVIVIKDVVEAIIARRRLHPIH